MKNFFPWSAFAWNIFVNYNVQQNVIATNANIASKGLNISLILII